MPTYNYKCPNCNTEKDVVKSIKDSDTQELCPRCNRFMVKQISGGCGFILKGTGYYKTGGFK